MLTAIILALAAGVAQLAQAAGQTIQQWLSSPAGQQFIQNCIQCIGEEGLRELFRRLGID